MTQQSPRRSFSLLLLTFLNLTSSHPHSTPSTPVKNRTPVFSVVPSRDSGSLVQSNLVDPSDFCVIVSLVTSIKKNRAFSAALVILL